MTNIWFWEKK